VRIRYLLSALFIIFSINNLFAQEYLVNGKVIDSRTCKPLAFVNIVINEGKYGGITDIDGYFFLKSSQEVRTLRLSYVGYRTKVYKVDEDSKNIIIGLERIKILLDEVVIMPGVNPAHRIINNVINNRDKNDPEKLKSFSYTSYDKTIFTLNIDSLRNIDTSLLKSDEKELVEFLNDKDFFIMENVTERKYLYPDRNYEKVIASKASGFKDPIFVFLVSQIQSTTFYSEIIHIVRKNYVNPISKGSTGKYFFLIEDTAYTKTNDTVFIISFRPKRNTNFDGLKGVLSINSNGWAIQNVRAEPTEISEGFNIRIQQLYKLIDDKQWFPVQLNTDVIFGNIQATTGKGDYDLIGIGKSYIRDIVLNPELIKRQLGRLGVEVDLKATNRSEEYWKTYRYDSLTSKNNKTYAFVDSIGKAHHFDRAAKSFETIMTGKIPWKIFDIDLDKLFRYNNYEGFYLGLGLHTNEHLSGFFNIGGYWGYGFGDKSAKHGGDLNVSLCRDIEMKTRISYMNDVTESAGVSFFNDKTGVFREENFREFLIKRKNKTRDCKLSLEFRTLKYFMLYMALGVSHKEAYKNYQYGVTSKGVAMLFDEFNFTNLTFAFRYAFREKFIKTRNAQMSLGSKYPVVWFQYTKGFNNFLKGEYDYNRFDIKVEESFYFKYLGETSIQLRGGYIDGDLPYCNLYNGHGSYRVFTIFAPNSFSTMRMNEFLSNRYVAVYFSHNFGKLLFHIKRFSPEFVFTTNVGFGALNNKNKHFNVDFNTMDKGYYESGILINNILNLRLFSIGLGACYRYGPYSLDKTIDNFAFKCTIVYSFKRSELPSKL
jgi:hypothetical protein